MTSRLVALVLDANEPFRLAEFWSVALHWEIDAQGGEVSLTPTDGTGLRVRFEPVRNAKVGRNRHHLDLATSSFDDQRETVSTLVQLGARHVDVGQGAQDEHVVLADPEGNEFCVIEPTNTFLVDCGRLGAINCDGTRATGHFWSAAMGRPLVWDQDEETAIRATDSNGPLITWSGPPLMEKPAKNRLHLDIEPSGGCYQASEVERLITLGATRLDVGGGVDGRVVMADLDGNEFCVLNLEEP